MSIPNQIAIDSTNNAVTVQTDENLLLITNVSYNAQITPPTSNQIVVEADPVNIDIQTSDKSIFTYNETPIVEVDVIQPITKVIQVATIGAQGPVGPVGPIGPPGVITAASGLIVTGSIFVSGSPGSVTATSFTGSIDASNIVGLNLALISTGSVTASVNIDNNTFRIQSGSSTYFFISSSGRIGIGTTTPNLGVLQLGATVENPHANLVVNGENTGTASITVRANNGLTSNQKTYNPVGGSDSLNFIQLLDTDTTTQTNQPIGRIIFTSNDGDTNQFVNKAFIEAVAEDSTPDSFLAFGTNQSGSNTTERMRINSLGNVGIGTTTPINTLQVNGGITATSFTGSFSGSVRAPGSTTQLIYNNNGVLGATSNITYTSNLLQVSTGQVTIDNALYIPALKADQGGPALLVGDGSNDPKYYAIIPIVYSSKGAAAEGQKAYGTRQIERGGKQNYDFILSKNIIDGDPDTGTTSSIMTLTDQERVGIGTSDPRAKLEVLGSVLISGSNTLTNVGPAVFSGSIDVTQGDVTLQESLYIIKKVSIGTTHQSASLTISGSSSNDTLLVKLNDNNGDTDKFKINNEGIVVLGALSSSPTPVAGGIYFSTENDYFFGFL